MTRYFSAGVSVFLLVLYGILVLYGLIKLGLDPSTTKAAVSNESAVKAVEDIFNQETALFFPLLSGLIGALVTAVLGIASPDDNNVVSNKLFSIEPNTAESDLANKIISAYVLTWMILGALTFLIATLGLFWVKEGVHSTVLYEHGKVWSGLAIGATYAYFNLNR